MNKQRITRYISKTKKCEFPRYIIAVDTETYITPINKKQKEHSLRLGYAIYAYKKNNKYEIRKEILFRTSEQFFNFLDELFYQKTKLYIFAHNAKFDYHILKMEEYFSKRHFEISVWNIRNTFFVTARNKITKQTIIFSDTHNYFNTSLKEIGKFLNYQKLQEPNFENVPDEELAVYCQRDTEIVLKAVLTFIEFIKENNLGSFKLTIASQAFNSFSHNFLHHKILIHNYNEILDLELQSYRGGRTEAFHLGKLNNIYYLDVNSLYPYVMKNFQYPIIPLVKKPIVNVSLNQLENLLNEKFLLAEVKVNLKEPCLAVKREKLIFPIGKFKTVILTPEIEYLLNSENEIEKIYQVVSYDKANIFDEYINFFYKLKKDSNNIIIREFTKIFLNSLYGKFGQKQYEQSILENDEDTKRTILDLMNEVNERTLTYGLISYYLLGSDLYKNIKCNGLGINSCPIIASNVTANARLYLWQLIKEAKKENVFYCDTDSLFVNEIGYNNLKTNNFIHKNELGKLKIENYGDVEIKGSKWYRFNDIEKIKGIKKTAIKINDTKYIQEHFETGKRHYLNRAGIILQTTVEKNLNEIYDKGITLESGEIQPYYLTEI